MAPTVFVFAGLPAQDDRACPPLTGTPSRLPPAKIFGDFGTAVGRMGRVWQTQTDRLSVLSVRCREEAGILGVQKVGGEVVNNLGGGGYFWTENGWNGEGDKEGGLDSILRLVAFNRFAIWRLFSSFGRLRVAPPPP